MKNFPKIAAFICCIITIAVSILVLKPNVFNIQPVLTKAEQFLAISIAITTGLVTVLFLFLSVDVTNFTDVEEEWPIKNQ